MPMKFVCQHCDQVLSVSSRKAGKRGKCPKCSEPITVPSREEAVKMIARRKRLIPPEAETDDDPYSQFVVYEDSELIYETEKPEDTVETSRRSDQEKLAIPRLALYVQGVSLGVVALVSFSLGMAVGIFSAPDNPGAATASKPCVISGQVEYRVGNNQARPDSGAVVILLPSGKQMEQRTPISGLRPEAPAPDRNGPAIRALLELGGNYGRTNRDGEFKIRVPDVGDYYVLVISTRNQQNGELPDNTHIGQMSDYFDSASNLLGTNRYHWKRERILRDRRLVALMFD